MRKDIKRWMTESRGVSTRRMGYRAEPSFPGFPDTAGLYFEAQVSISTGNSWEDRSNGKASKIPYTVGASFQPSCLPTAPPQHHRKEYSLDRLYSSGHLRLHEKRLDASLAFIL